MKVSILGGFNRCFVAHVLVVAGTAASLLLALAATACGTKMDPVYEYGDLGQSPADLDYSVLDLPYMGNPGHTESHAGILHKPGGSDPLVNCVSCHGAQLKGSVGTSCYKCHNNSDHNSNREGVRHKSGSNSSCNKCHGPGNKGGLGSHCAKCHGTNNPSDD